MTVSRDIGLLPILQNLTPEPVNLAFIAITQLGGIPVLLGIAAGLYWFHDRRIGAITLAAVIAAGALTTGLKAFFGLPRPPASYHVITADGYGFPSGHATAATITWLTLAVHGSFSTRQRRTATALGIIGLVCLSRVILGVHYPLDVAAGVVVGLFYLAVTASGPVDDPGWALTLALATSLVALLIARTPDAVFFASAAVTSRFAWRTWSITQTPHERILLRLAIPVGLLGGTTGITYVFFPSIPLALVAGTLIGTCLIGLPVFSSRYLRK